MGDLVQKAMALVALASDESTTLEERSTAALQVVSFLHSGRLKLVLSTYEFPPGTEISGWGESSVRVKVLVTSNLLPGHMHVWVPRHVIIHPKDLSPSHPELDLGSSLKLVVDLNWARARGLR